MSINDNEPCISKSISAGMSDDERYELLKDRVITVPYFDVDVLAQIDAGDYAELERIGKSGAFKILREIDRSRILGHTPDNKIIEPYPLPASVTVSLTKLLSNVNVADENLLKYIPDGFLDDKQKAAKQIALKDTLDYIERKNKQRYIETDGAGFVNEAVVDYLAETEDENSIVFIFHRKAG